MDKTIKPHIIFHIDMNAYFASCEIKLNPRLANLPVVVSHVGSSRHSIILTANYIARKYGIHSAMRLSEAQLRCHNLIICEPKYDFYVKTSDEIMKYLTSISPLIEIASIDEAYLDVTNVECNNDYPALAKEIQDHILNVIGIPCSVGIAPNKLLAKMASDMKKPLGIVVLRKRDVPNLMYPLPIEDLFGAGKKTVERLKAIKIHTIGDLANYPDEAILVDLLGQSMANSLIEAARGNGDNIVDPHRYDEVSSISNATTFEFSLVNLDEISLNLKILVNTVTNRLVKHHLVSKNIGIQIRYDDFYTITRQLMIENYTDDSQVIYKVAKQLLDDNLDSNRPVRLLGVSLNKVKEKKDIVVKHTLFDDLDELEKQLQINKLVNEINQQYGNTSLKIGVNKEKK